MKILFKFPSRARPVKFFKTIDNVLNLIEDKNNFIIEVSLDTDDITMNTESVIEKIKEYSCIHVTWGFSKNKIDAVNRDIPKEGWDILVLLSDDMVFLKVAFDTIIRKDFVRNGLDKLVFYYDGHATGPIISFPVMGKKYYDSFGYIYHPSYKSLFCDDELFAVASRTNRLVIGARDLVEHQHPIWGFGTSDDLLKYSESFYKADLATFEKRKRLNFFIQ